MIKIKISMKERLMNLKKRKRKINLKIMNNKKKKSMKKLMKRNNNNNSCKDNLQ